MTEQEVEEFVAARNYLPPGVVQALTIYGQFIELDEALMIDKILKAIEERVQANPVEALLRLAKFAQSVSRKVPVPEPTQPEEQDVETEKAHLKLTLDALQKLRQDITAMESSDPFDALRKECLTYAKKPHHDGPCDDVCARMSLIALMFEQMAQLPVKSPDWEITQMQALHILDQVNAIFLEKARKHAIV